MSRQADPQGIRARLWRYVRDAGRNGVPAVAVLDHFENLDEGCVRNHLYLLKAHNFITQTEARKPYFVDADCKVPAGERAELGPGWDEPADEAPSVQRSVKWTMPIGGIGTGIGITMSDLVADTSPSRRPPPAPLPPPQIEVPVFINELANPSKQPAAPGRVHTPKGAGFRAALSSEDTLLLRLTGGQELELCQQDTARLVAWLSRPAAQSMLGHQHG